MTSSDRDFFAKKIIKIVEDLLSEERILAKIDEPINMVKRRFNFTVSEPVPHSDFNLVISDFVQKVYRDGLRLSRQLSDSEALAEAIFLLETYYHGEHLNGYEAAILDAEGHDRECLDFVLFQMAEIIKAVERKKYLQWVFATNIDCLDWNMRRHIVEVYFEQYKNIIQKNLLDLDPARIADHLNDLILPPY